MYENEIEDLDRFKTYTTAWFGGIVDTAIALMRAAQPADEAAEREHCAHVKFPRGRSEFCDLLLRERAAVRAANVAKMDAVSRAYTQVRDLCAKAQRREESAEVRALNAERALAALKAAAQPRDEAAEREHCDLSCSEMLLQGEVIEAWLLRERAAARAEGYAAAKAEEQ